VIDRFLPYIEKVFHWSELIAQVSDSRPRPRISIQQALTSVVLMFALRLGSLNALEELMRSSGRWVSLVGRRAISADTIGRIMARIPPDELRRLLCWIARHMRRNKVLDDNPWPLRLIAVDAHEFFSLTQPLLPPVPDAPDQAGRGNGHPVLPSRGLRPTDRL